MAVVAAAAAAVVVAEEDKTDGEVEAEAAVAIWEAPGAAAVEPVEATVSRGSRGNSFCSERVAYRWCYLAQEVARGITAALAITGEAVMIVGAAEEIPASEADTKIVSAADQCAEAVVAAVDRDQPPIMPVGIAVE